MENKYDKDEFLDIGNSNKNGYDAISQNTHLKSFSDNKPKVGMPELQNKVKNELEQSLSSLRQDGENASDKENEYDSAKTSTTLKPIRTYKNDLAEVMINKKTSIVSIAAAENKRRTQSIDLIRDKQEKESYFRKFGIIILSVVLIIVGGGSAFYFYLGSGVEPVEPNVKIVSIIFSDNDEEFEITGLSKRQILNKLNILKDEASMALGNIKNIFITESFIGEEGIEKKFIVSTKDFLDVIGIHAPPSFLRSLDQQFMIGVHTFDGNQPFIILRTNSYENAFAGMLEWEKEIKDDLFPLFGNTDILIPAGKTALTPASFFSDMVIKNQDIRALKNSDGKIEIMYAFIGQNTIIITTNEHTFTEIVTRITASRSRK